jgi:hypothetical protein
MVPRDLMGQELMPLNELKEEYSEVYEREVKKYEGRESILGTRIHPLDCLWNDVLHFTAIHPLNILEILQKLDFPTDRIRKWFAVDISKFNPENTIVFLDKQSIDRNAEEQYVAFEKNDLPIYQNIPQETLEYYKAMRNQGKMPLLFHGVPHIFYRGRFAKKDLIEIEFEENQR